MSAQGLMGGWHLQRGYARPRKESRQEHDRDKHATCYQVTKRSVQHERIYTCECLLSGFFPFNIYKLQRKLRDHGLLKGWKSKLQRRRLLGCFHNLPFYFQYCFICVCLCVYVVVTKIVEWILFYVSFFFLPNNNVFF